MKRNIIIGLAICIIGCAFGATQFVNCTNNGELLGKWGNFINRTLQFINKSFDGKLNNYDIDSNIEKDLINLYDLIGTNIDDGNVKEGLRNIFETVLSIDSPNSNITINADDDNLDGLNYLVGKDLDYVNKKAMEGTMEAHVTGDVPNISITIEKLDEENIGELIYFFELACGMSGNILGVNPFNQPGVEEYKKNMFRLLEKPGY